MTTATITVGQLSEAEHSRQLRRAVVASTVGTIIEAYDLYEGLGVKRDVVLARAAMTAA